MCPWFWGVHSKRSTNFLKEKSFKAPIPPVRSTWNATRLLIRGPLTDRKIEIYRQQGWYSSEFRRARRERIDAENKKREERERREGNFTTTKDGRLIYSPI